MQSAINIIHAFIDGNGRLARFFLSLEAEKAERPIVLFFPEQRRDVVHCLVEARYKQNFEPYREVLQQAYSQTAIHLEQFHGLVEKGRKDRKT